MPLFGGPKESRLVMLVAAVSQQDLNAHAKRWLVNGSLDPRVFIYDTVHYKTREALQPIMNADVIWSSIVLTDEQVAEWKAHDRYSLHRGIIDNWKDMSESKHIYEAVRKGSLRIYREGFSWDKALPDDPNRVLVQKSEFFIVAQFAHNKVPYGLGEVGRDILFP